ncbi:MAG: HrpE/YscL family type III secretion apparatus protein [Pseudomonadota bacterium]
MVAVVRVIPGGLRLAPEQKIIKAADYQVYLEARALIAAAQAEADTLRAEAQQAFTAEQARGYADGQEQAADALSNQLMEASDRILDYLSGVENDMTELVSQATAKVLGRLPPQDLVMAVVQEALRHARDQKRITLRVAPEQLEIVRERLAEIAGEYAEMNSLDVVGDERVGAGGCLIETPMGLVDARLETQLRNLRERLSHRFTDR